RSILDIAGQLPASRRNIVAPRLAHRGYDAGIHEPLRAKTDTRRRRPPQAGLRKRIEWNQIGFATRLFRNSSQFAGMLVAVVDAIEHDVLESDEIARSMLEIAITGREQFGQRMFAVERHEAVAQGVVGRMQGNR